MFRNQCTYAKVLVGSHGKGKKDFLDELESDGNCKKAMGDEFLRFYMLQQGSFGKAMLATLKMPKSLVARIMKAKYFPNCSILDACQGSRPSFSWRSIHSACSLLWEGFIWRVGNGEKICTWQDKWIP